MEKVTAAAMITNVIVAPKDIFLFICFLQSLLEMSHHTRYCRYSSGFACRLPDFKMNMQASGPADRAGLSSSLTAGAIAARIDHNPAVMRI